MIKLPKPLTKSAKAVFYAVTAIVIILSLLRIFGIFWP
ncbi:hypothetical protein ES703_68440 [subsurface metagenome]